MRTTGARGEMILPCGVEAKALGIEEADGSLSYDKFYEHIETCDQCRDAATA